MQFYALIKLEHHSATVILIRSISEADLIDFKLTGLGRVDYYNQQILLLISGQLA